MAHTYRAQEHEDLEIPIEAMFSGTELQIFPEIEKKGYFRAYFKGKKFVFQAAGFVGLIPLNRNVFIDVIPRVPVSNLDRLIRISDYVADHLEGTEQLFASSGEVMPSTLNLLCDSLLSKCEAIATFGFFKDYVAETRVSASPRGRIQAKATLTGPWMRGKSHQVVFSEYVRTHDNAVNRCVKAALWRLSRASQLATNRARRRALNLAYMRLDGVRLDEAAECLRHPFVHNPRQMPDAMRYYEPLLRVSKAIILGTQLSTIRSGDGIPVSAFVISLESVFESYVRNILKFALAQSRVLDGNKLPPGGGAQQLLKGKDALNPSIQNLATPDAIVIEPISGRIAAVIEVKYKRIEDTPERADLNQALAYGISYEVPVVVMIYPLLSRDVVRLKFLGRHGGTDMYRYFIDLGAEELTKEEDDLSKAIARLALRQAEPI
jgi:5-methylcytosine-specific restriction enzyme subunit McrC